jgi:HD-GYP domain-containing protein (c-di-GMP phosphodiesterase class II)
MDEGLRFGSVGTGGTSRVEALSLEPGKELFAYHAAKGHAFTFASAKEASAGRYFILVLSGRMRASGCGAGRELGPMEWVTFRSLEERVKLQAVEDSVMFVFSDARSFATLDGNILQLKAMKASVVDKDGATGEHLERVRELCSSIGERLGLGAQAVLELGYAASFHDLGKIAIPDPILKKPGPLTPDEFAVMKTHVEVSANVFRREYQGRRTMFDVDRVAIIILQHHERLDGSGYPYGLRGEEILLEAKILGAVDAFDAMISKRCYSDALTPTEALARLAEASKAFDARVVEELSELV